MKRILLIAISIVASIGQIKPQEFIPTKHFLVVNRFDSMDDVYLEHPEILPEDTIISIKENEILFYNAFKRVIKTIVRNHNIDIDTNVNFHGEKTTGIRKVYYYKVVNNKLLTETIGLTGTSGDPHQYKSIEKKVFNADGEFIAHIDPTHEINISSDGKYFVSLFEGEADGTYPLVLYNIKGERVCQHYSSPLAYFSFQSGKNILTINNPENMNLTLLDTSCNEILNLNYSEEINFGNIMSSFISSTYNLVLLSNSFNIVLLRDDKSEVWRTNEYFVQQCFFLEKEDELLLKVWNNSLELKNNQYQIKLVKISDGETIESLNADEVIVINKSYFIIKKQGIYYEYLVI